MSNNILNDELRIYRGEDYAISQDIRIHQPTLGEICEYGEAGYFSMVNMLTATPQTLKAQLWYEMGVDYTTITPYELFYQMLYRIYPKEMTSILFKDLDLTAFEPRMDADGRVVMTQIYTNSDSGVQSEIWFDEAMYESMTDYLRKVHDIPKDEKIPMNEYTKKAEIEDAMEALQRNASRPYRSQLKNLISSMVNSEGFKYNHSQVWDMKINAFMDAVKRISKIKNATLLLQSGYSGFGINLKEVSDSQINWLGNLT